MSRSPGQTSVPCSTFTCANVIGSRKGSSTPRQSSAVKSTSPMVPSSNVKRRLWGPTTSTAATYENKSNVCAIFAILGEWLNCHKRSTVPRQSPVSKDLVTVRLGPFLDKALSAIWQRACQESAVSCDRGSPVGVFRMKMRNRMVSLTPVHGDHDPVEGADARHPTQRTHCLGRESVAPTVSLPCR